MTATQRKLITAIRDYAQNTLDQPNLDEDGTGILSALINTVDSAIEGTIPDQDGLQSNREGVLVRFLLSHDNNNLYATTDAPKGWDKIG